MYKKMTTNTNYSLNSYFSKFIKTQFNEDSEWLQWLENLILFNDIQHGNWPIYHELISHIPEIKQNRVVDLNKPSIYASYFIDKNESDKISSLLNSLKPWRKGPYEICGINIDTEWRSDLKWDRLFPHIQSLENRRVLDVGTGSGYHLWRMLGAGARVAVGVEPTIHSVAQFLTISAFMGQHAIWVVPTTLESLERKPLFDTVFSMGVLYHRRNPLSHLKELAECLRTEGELVLETLVAAGDETTCLIPVDRYAGMRNVWFIPSVPQLLIWLKRVGFRNARLVSCAPTTPEEQRCTEWLGDKPSLIDVLDPLDPTRTIEGYPAPVRAIVLAEKV